MHLVLGDLRKAPASAEAASDDLLLAPSSDPVCCAGCHATCHAFVPLRDNPVAAPQLHCCNPHLPKAVPVSGPWQTSAGYLRHEGSM